MLDFPIVDTHLHVWDTGRLHYPWLDGDPLLGKPYLLADYDAATQGEQVEQMVFLQCEVEFAQFRDEAAWVGALAEQEPRLTGIVPWAPLEMGDEARPDLEWLAANPRVKAIRRIIQFEPDINFCLRPGFIKGVQILSDYDLAFDLCINHLQMENTITLVRQCPNVRFILDHIGKPNIKDHLLDPWRANLRTLASMDNVWCKMSGLVTEADQQNWTVEDLKPYIDHVIECFGFERVAFGGDYPVVTRAARWQQWVDALVTALAGVAREDLQKLFHDNAIAFYRLG